MKQQSGSSEPASCLVVGASGFLGRAVSAELTERRVDYTGTRHSGSMSSGDGLVRFRFPTDRARDLPGLGSASHLLITARLADPKTTSSRGRTEFEAALERLCTDFLYNGARRQFGKIVYISSDAVFSGRKGQYADTDPPDADTEYGRRHRIAEEVITKHCENGLIIRTSYIFDRNEPDADRRFQSLRRAIEAGQTFRADANVVKSPIAVDSLARFVADHTLSGVRGILHAPGTRMSAREFYGLGLDLMQLSDQKAALVSGGRTAGSDTSLTPSSGPRTI
jgi:nucleoside-diphosphate-sugar epimerase